MSFSEKFFSNNERGHFKTPPKVSAIIPARNEESNLPKILGSLAKQTLPPHEIIVVDDFSTDATAEIAKNYGAHVIHNPELPDGWTGKNWALWNGYLASTGDVLVFLDADVTLAPIALEALIKARERTGGVISVVPYHNTERFYERLSLVTYILSIFVFTSPFERNNPKKGLFGPCIVTTRHDYERINGHKSIQGEVLDDLKLGKKFIEAGIPVENYLGNKIVSFRLYPNGLRSELEGYGKSAALGTMMFTSTTLIFIVLWLLGLFTTGLVFPFLLITQHNAVVWPFLAGYILYTLQFFYLLKYTGQYGVLMPIIHFLSLLFFIVMMFYSLYQVLFVGSVSWKGRQINIRTIHHEREERL